MSKIVIAMLLGACCASSWWAAAFFDTVLSPLAVLTSIGVFVWVIHETIDILQ